MSGGLMPVDYLEDAREFTFHWDQELGDTDLVIPKAFRLDNAVPIAGDQWSERWQLVVTGLAFSVTTGAGPLGVILQSQIPGEPARKLWSHVSAATATVAGGFRCRWVLSPGGASTPSADPARLSVLRVGSVVNASLTVTVAFRPAEGRTIHQLTPPYTQPS